MLLPDNVIMMQNPQSATDFKALLLPKVFDATSRLETEPSDITMPDNVVRLGLEPLFTAERTRP